MDKWNENGNVSGSVVSILIIYFRTVYNVSSVTGVQGRAVDYMPKPVVSFTHNTTDYTQLPLEPQKALYHCFHICSSSSQTHVNV